MTNPCADLSGGAPLRAGQRRRGRAGQQEGGGRTAQEEEGRPGQAGSRRRWQGELHKLRGREGGLQLRNAFQHFKLLQFSSHDVNIYIHEG